MSNNRSKFDDTTGINIIKYNDDNTGNIDCIKLCKNQTPKQRCLAQVKKNDYNNFQNINCNETITKGNICYCSIWYDRFGNKSRYDYKNKMHTGYLNRYNNNNKLY